MKHLYRKGILFATIILGLLPITHSLKIVTTTTVKWTEKPGNIAMIALIVIVILIALVLFYKREAKK